jgi:hypothetical protein
VALLGDALRASGGLDLWRQMRRYTLHLSIGGILCSRYRSGVRLKELLVEGGIHEQSLEIIGFTASDRRVLYEPDWIALEGADGRRLKERRASVAESRSSLDSRVWDELQLAHYCGYLIWNYINVPFILSKPDFRVEELEPTIEQGATLRRLKAHFPAQVATHAPEQIFHFDEGGRLRRLDYAAAFENARPVVQVFSGHQRFSGILVPTLSRVVSIPPDDSSAVKSSWIDIEIFDAVFER